MPEIRCRRCGEPVPSGNTECPHCGAPAPEDVTLTSSRHRTRFSEGDVLDGRYEIVETLPTGGMGELYKVRHVHLGDFRVIKVRKPMGKKDETGQKRFAREARLAASLKHPNLATLYDFSTLPDGSHYMVFEFVDGLTVAEHIQEGGRFETMQVLRVAEQTLNALSILHNAGIIHRDIASDNLMLATDPAGETIVKVIDLGIAKPLDGEGLTSTGFFVGKARYASPEQVNTQDPMPIDTRSDLYSLGVVLYEMVSGDVPFAGSTPAASVIKRLTEDVTNVPPRDTAMILEPDVEAFILSLLRRDREERVQTADEALAAVRQVLAQRPDANDGSALARITRDRELHKLAAKSDPGETPVPRKGTVEMPLEEIQKAQLEDLREATHHGSVEAPPTAPVDLDDVVEETEALPKLDKEARNKLMGVGKKVETEDDSDVPTDELPIQPKDDVDQAAPTMPFEKYKKQQMPDDESRKPTASPESAVPFMADAEPPEEDSPPDVEPAMEEPPAPEPPEAATVSPVPEKKAKEPAPTPTPASPAKPSPPPAGPPERKPAPPPSPAPRQPEQSSLPYVTSANPDNKRRTLLVLALLLVFALLALGVAGYAAYRILEKISADARPEPSAGISVATEPAPAEAPEPEIMEVVEYGPPVPEGFEEPKPPEPPRPKPKPRLTPPPSPEPVEEELEPEPEPEPPEPPPAPAVEGDLVQPGPGVEDASVIAKAALRLPLRARFRGAKGTATIDVLVGIKGVPEEVRMVKRSGDKDIDEAALEAARNSRFIPATKDGVRVRIWKRLDFGNEE